ncbi:interleukin-21 [Nelusetta ayraudi]|uniref:interleukin-21 n=1 Tax=Nelusetta ayraudi TaxID=303726 RepID=UPI003F705D1F
MKLLGFCLLVVCCCCWSLASPPKNRRSFSLQRSKLEEAYRQLRSVKQALQHSEKLLYTPPKNIEDCCCLPALECFRANFNLTFQATEGHHRKFYRSLENPITVRGLCDSQSSNSTCQDCHAHPKQSAQEFFNRLESLIQKAIARLSDN